MFTIQIIGLIKERDLVKVCLGQVLGLPVNLCVTRLNDPEKRPTIF